MHIFSAAVKMPSVCIVLTNAAEQDWEIHQIDTKNVYLQALLKETIIMRPPPGVSNPEQEGKVVHLLKGFTDSNRLGADGTRSSPNFWCLIWTLNSQH